MGKLHITPAGSAQMADNNQNIDAPERIDSLKISYSSVEWVRDEVRKRSKALGRKVTQNEVVVELIELYKHGGGEISLPTTDPGTPVATVPKSILPLIKHILWLYAETRAQDLETLKAALLANAAEHERALKAEKKT
jgi:hypothetical protein